jgi:hypothetical protein
VRTPIFFILGIGVGRRSAVMNGANLSISERLGETMRPIADRRHHVYCGDSAAESREAEMKWLCVSVLIVVGQVVSSQAPTHPTMSDDVVSDLLALATTHSSHQFRPITKVVDESRIILVTSHRMLMASKNASVIEKGGRYRPPAADRLDAVVIECGDADLEEVFDCNRLSVIDSTGTAIDPLSVDAGPKVFRNAAGESWTVRTVIAQYPIEPLRSGFDVTAHVPDGTEWPLTVTAEQALNQLLIGQSIPSHVRARASVSHTPPSQLRVRIRSEGDRWRIASLDQSFVWTDCLAYIGDSSARVATLEPGGTVLIDRGEFFPAVTGDAPPPAIICTVGGRTFGANTPPSR